MQASQTHPIKHTQPKWNWTPTLPCHPIQSNPISQPKEKSTQQPTQPTDRPTNQTQRTAKRCNWIRFYKCFYCLFLGGMERENLRFNPKPFIWVLYNDNHHAQYNYHDGRARQAVRWVHQSLEYPFIKSFKDQHLAVSHHCYAFSPFHTLY